MDDATSAVDPTRDGIGIDPIRFEVIRNALVEIAEEMAASLRRSAYSTNIKTRADFSCAFFDHKMRAIAQSFAQPSHLGSLVRLVPAAVADYGPERLGPGDSILVNHPYIGGGHLNDVTLIAPFVYQGTVLGYVACLAHHVDVGGGAPASVGAFQEVFQEGIIIPPVKLVENGAIVTDIYRLVLEQIRSKRETAGDLRAQIACNNTGVRRLTGLVDQLGADAFVAYLDELVAYTERRTIAAIAALPRGSFFAEGLVDTDGFSDEPVHLSARFTVDDDGVLFDLTGLRPAASRAGQLDVCPDLLQLRLRAQVAHRPGHPGQRRLLPVRAGPCAGRDGRQRHPPGPRRGRLGDGHAPRRDAAAWRSRRRCRSGSRRGRRG